MRNPWNLHEAILFVPFQQGPRSAKPRNSCLWGRVVGRMETAFNSEIGCKAWSPSNGIDPNFQNHSRSYCYKRCRRLEEVAVGVWSPQDYPDKQTNCWVEVSWVPCGPVAGGFFQLLFSTVFSSASPKWKLSRIDWIETSICFKFQPCFEIAQLNMKYHLFSSTFSGRPEFKPCRQSPRGPVW